MNKHILFILFLLVLLLGSCGNEPETVSQEIELKFVLPAGTVMSQPNKSPAHKVMGDPGTTESFRKPRYGWFYLVYSDGEDEHVFVLNNGPIDESDWTKEQYSGQFATTDDWIYTYSQSQKILLLGEGHSKLRTWGRLYAAMSYEDLTPYVKGHDASYKPQSEADIKNIVFSNNTDAVKNSLQDIYSSPAGYIYEPWGEYYGTVRNLPNTPTPSVGEMRVYMPLYHVASKVDVMWNVAPSVQTEMHVTSMKATHLYDGECYLFRPTDNTIDAATFAGGYERQITLNNIGMQWEGRYYFYAIPYKNNADKCPLQLEVQANNDTSGSYKETVLNDPSSPFVPWIRGQISITQNMTGLYKYN